MQQACETGGTSVWASGSDPGFITETLPLALLSVQRRVDLIEIEEFGDLSHRPSPHMVMEQMRFGKPLAEFDPERRKDHLFGEYQPPLSVLADLAGFAIDEWTGEGGVAAAKEDLTIVAGEIKKGTAAAQRVVVTGRGGGVDRIRFTQYGFVAMDVEPDWGLQPTGWRIRIHGDAPFDLSMPFPVSLDDLAGYVPAYNANGLVNAIPAVCAAPPGILTTEDLPHFLPRELAMDDPTRGPLTRAVLEYTEVMQGLVPVWPAPRTGLRSPSSWRWTTSSGWARSSRCRPGRSTPRCSPCGPRPSRGSRRRCSGSPSCPGRRLLRDRGAPRPR